MSKNAATANATAHRPYDWAWKIPHLTCQQRCVLVALADDANSDGTVWPSANSLAAKVCLSDRQLRRILKQLEAHNLISIEHRYRDDGSFTSNMYYLNVSLDPVKFLLKNDSQSDVHLMRHQQCEEFIEAIRKQMPDRVHDFLTWLRPIKIVEIEKAGRLKLRAPNQYFVDVITAKFSDVVLAAAKSIDPRIRRFDFMPSTPTEK